MNGPVPTGFWKKALCDLPPKLAGRMPFVKSEMSASSGAQGYLVWMTTVDASLAVTFLMAESMYPRPRVLFRARLMEKATSLAVKSLPSENLTPGRRETVSYTHLRAHETDSY